MPSKFRVAAEAVKYGVDWPAVGRDSVTIFGLIGVVVTIASVLVYNPQGSRSVTLWALLYAAVVGLVIAVIRNHVPPVEEWTVPDCQGRLRFRIRRGDLFDPVVCHMTTVIPVNRRFGMTTTDVVAESLIRKLADLHGGPASILASGPSIQFDSPIDAPVGQCQELELQGRPYLLVAATTIPELGHTRTSLPIGDCWVALSALWRWGESRRRDIRLPVLGSGNSGSALGHELLMALIAVSILVEAHENPPRFVQTIELVIYPPDWTPKRLQQLRALLKDLGYSSGS